MNKRKKMVVKIVAVAAIICAVSLVLPLPFNPWHPVGIVAMAFRAGRIRVRLLSETDHQVLLEACREVMKRGDLESGRRYWVHPSQPSPEVSRLPRAIIDLEPSYVCINDLFGYMVIVMHRGMANFGVNAYPENFQKPFPNYRYGNKELVEGLWYFDDGYGPGTDSAYDKKIEALLKKRKQAH